jgi:hypothetical protein
MANLKISQLTATTTNDIGSWVVINNSGETTTNKSQLENVLGLTIGTGADSIRSSDVLTTSGGTASGQDTIAIGNGAQALEAQGIAIGKSSIAGRERDIAIGFGANTDPIESEDGVAIGTDARVVRDYGIAIGYDAVALTDGIAIGRSTRPIGDTCIAIGRQNVSAGNRGYAIGASIFCDRDDAGAIGSTVYVDGARSVAIGANGTIGQSGGSCEDSVNIGSDNDIAGGSHKQVSIGYQANTAGTGAINISSGGFPVNSSYGINIGGTGNTLASGTVLFGEGNIRIGGFNETINFTPGNNNTWIGGLQNTWNTSGGLGDNNVFLGLSGRTLSPGTNNTTYVENLAVYGSITQGFTTYSDAGTIIIDPSTQGYVQIEATGGTYNIQVSPAPNNIGDTVTLFVEYTSGATVNFASPGVVQWKFQEAYGKTAPVFSATTVTRSIIVFNTWDGNDMWEVSRSMNMA